MPQFNSYYSGPALEGINRGRTADAAVDAQDAASQRSYLASIAAERNRNQLGNRELDVRQNLGTQDIGLRRYLGEGTLNNQAFANDTTRGLGIDEIRSKAEQAKLNANTALAAINGQIKQAEIQAQGLLDYAKVGGGMNPTIERELMRNQEQQRQLKAQAESAAAIANADLETLIKNLNPPNLSWDNAFTPRILYDTPEMRRNYFDTNPDVRSSTIGTVLRGLGPDAGTVSYDPTLKTFVPSRTLFPNGGFAPPAGIGTTPDGSYIVDPSMRSPVVIPPRSLWQRYQSSGR